MASHYSEWVKQVPNETTISSWKIPAFSVSSGLLRCVPHSWLLLLQVGQDLARDDSFPLFLMETISGVSLGQIPSKAWHIWKDLLGCAEILSDQ